MNYRPALISAALLDEHAVVLAGLQQLLVEDEDFQVVSACRSLQELRAQLPLLARAPDMVIVDPLARSPLGLLQIEEIRRLLPSTVLVAFCTRPGPALIERATALGADACLSKCLPSADLGRTLRGLFYAGPRRHAPGGDEGDNVPLTGAQGRVVAMIADGMRVTEIAQQMRSSVKTISSHKSRAQRRLGVESTAELVLAWEMLRSRGTPGRDSPG